MEDTLATELVQVGSASSRDELAVADMARDASDKEGLSSMISEHPIRCFWRGYQELMGFGMMPSL
jgi:hypothetical protein